MVHPEVGLAVGEGTRALWMLIRAVEDDPNISVRKRSTIERITDSSVVVQTDGTFDEIDGVDSVIISVGNISCNEVGDALIFNGKIPAVYKIGDCLEPRKQKDAIQEGLAIGLRI